MGMPQGGAAPGPAPSPPARGDVVGRVLAAGLAIGAATGTISGGASFGPLGAMFGLVFGLGFTVVPTAVGVILLGITDPAGQPDAYLRRVDLVLGGYAVLAVLGTIWWLTRDALAVPVAPIAAIVTVAVGLWLARRSLRGVVAPAGGAGPTDVTDPRGQAF